MHRLLVIGFLISLTLQAWGQTGQTVRLAEGSKVTLHAHSEGAISFVWLRNGESILYQHDTSLVVSEAGIYTVVALGESCDSDLSDPVEVIITPGKQRQNVDMTIHGAPDRDAALIGQPIDYQIITGNKSDVTATEVEVVIQVPKEVTFGHIMGPFTGKAEYDQASREVKWVIDSVGAGQSESLHLVVHANQAGTAIQHSIVSSLENDSNPADNQHKSSVEILTLKIPNVFTPNDDRINDYFVITGLELMQRSKLSIFDRNGNEVYRHTNYQNNWNGKGLPSEVYYYILEVRFPNGKEHLFKGHVTILR